MNYSSRIAIIILNWNGKADTLACLESLSRLSYPHYEVIVVDNGSCDDSVSAIQAAFPMHTLIQTGENLGFAEGNNRGINYALEKGFDYLFLLNNDTVVSSDILEQFLSTQGAHPQAGILGAKLCLFDNPDRLDHLGGMWNLKEAKFDLVGLREPASLWQEVRPLDYVCGAGLFICRTVIEKIGLLESRFFLIWEEADFCFRARRAGFQVLTCPGAQVRHKVSASFVGGKPHSTYFWWRGRLLWIRRNCTLRERAGVWGRIVIPEVVHLLKLQLLKSLQLLLTFPFLSLSVRADKRAALRKRRAALCGIWDYVRRRFGNAPTWVYGRSRTRPG